MQVTRHAHTRQLTALLLIAVMVFVHVIKSGHTHPLIPDSAAHQQEKVIVPQSVQHGTCTICEFQLAKDASFTSEPLLLIAPVHAAPIYGRLLTNILPARLFIAGDRGPPLA